MEHMRLIYTYIMYAYTGHRNIAESMKILLYIFIFYILFNNNRTIYDVTLYEGPLFTGEKAGTTLLEK